MLDLKSWGFEDWITHIRTYECDKDIIAILQLLGENATFGYEAMGKAKRQGGSIAIAAFNNGVALHAEPDGKLMVTGHGEDPTDIRDFHLSLVNSRTFYRLYPNSVRPESVLA